MKLNTTAKGSRNKRTVVNPEGSIVLARKPEIQTYLEASNLKLSSKFYESPDDNLKRFISEASNLDNEFLQGLALFLTDNGIKLSPVVLYSLLSNKKFKFNDSTSDAAIKTFNTPQRVAEAIALKNLGYLSLNDSFKKKVLKASIEKMSEFTLLKNQMKSRKIKTRDLIKLLRPNPNVPEKNALRSKLYKDLIEFKAKVPENKRTFVSMKSDSKISGDVKKRWFEDNVETMPINELIRNLKFVSEQYDFDKSTALQKKIITKLKTIDDKSMRFLNVFDLVQAAIYVPSLQLALFDVIKDWADKVKKKFNYEGMSATVNFDISGSMNGPGIDNGFKYLVILSLIFDKLDVVYFSTDLYRPKRTEDIVKLLKKGQIRDAKDLLGSIFGAHTGGTALISTSKEILLEDDKDEIKTLVVISDEVSWKEGEDLRLEIDELDALLMGRSLILINPTIYSGTVFKKNVTAFASMTSNVIYNVMLSTNQDSFIKFIRNYGKDKQDNN